ncbi:MAG TPA: DUF5995 family protein, partial [Candidatus Saccharimonadales bacterium]|nr:DUF5995 family protein [Candidatus Saccharimonadales bacterium]
LYDVAEGARDAKLPNVSFADVYARLSERIYQNIDNYDKPDHLNKTSGIFLDAFLDPLRFYAEGVLEQDVEKLQRVPEHWRLAFFAPKVRETLPVAQFYMGMTAHIEGDLAQVLADSGVDEEYYHDYTHKVGEEIRQTSEELAPALLPAGSHALSKLVLPLVNASIANERQASWDGSIEITAARKVGDLDKEFTVINQLESRASRQINAVRHMGYAATRVGRLLRVV